MYPPTDWRLGSVICVPVKPVIYKTREACRATECQLEWGWGGYLHSAMSRRVNGLTGGAHESKAGKAEGGMAREGTMRE